MKNRQYSLKVLETTIEDEESFIEFFDTNYLLFKDHLIVLQGEMSDRLRRYLEEKSLKFLNNETLPEGRPRKALEKEFEVNKKVDPILKNKIDALQQQLKMLMKKNSAIKETYEAQIQEAKREMEKTSQNSTLLKSIVRSGTALEADGDIFLLNRVNSGATVYAKGNLIATDIVEGSLRCDGDFMIVSNSPKANIIFHDVVIENALLKHRLNLIELKENEIVIKRI